MSFHLCWIPTKVLFKQGAALVLARFLELRSSSIHPAAAASSRWKNNQFKTPETRSSSFGQREGPLEKTGLDLNEMLPAKDSPVTILSPIQSLTAEFDPAFLKRVTENEVPKDSGNKPKSMMDLSSVSPSHPSDHQSMVAAEEVVNNSTNGVVGSLPRLDETVPSHQKAISSGHVESEGRFSRRESSVPSGQLARIANFAGLGIGLAVGTVGELARQVVSGTLQGGSAGLKGLVLNEKNSERLTLALCRMRGAALKLGQLLSIQDEHVIPKDSPLRAVIDRVREEAEHMPAEQLYRVLRSELGAGWRSRLASFEDAPMAAASIGQVPPPPAPASAGQAARFRTAPAIARR
jgi:hypothetical protein